MVEYDSTITEYPVHSYVLFTPPVSGRSNKLLPRHRGPFQVLDRTNSIYTIEDLVSGKRSSTHIHNLRPFNITADSRPAERTGVRRRISPQPPRQPQLQIYCTMEFKVRWAGEFCDSWEPYKALLHVDKLHNYLWTNTMKTLIPKEHNYVPWGLESS